MTYPIRRNPESPGTSGTSGTSDDARLMAHAHGMAELSSHPRVRVGAILAMGGTILARGTNKAAYGCVDRTGPGANGLYRLHAEEAAVAAAASAGVSLRGADGYCTHRPCARCARLWIAAGIARVVHGPDVDGWPSADYEAAAAMLADAGVVVEAWHE